MANYKLSYTAAQFEQAMKAYNEKWKGCGCKNYRR